MLLLLPCGPVLAAGDWQVERLVAEPVFGGQMLVREAGRQHAEMVLLVHGLGDEAGTTWNGVVGTLSSQYHVVAPDLPGFGGSSKANELYSPHAYAQLLHYLITSLPAKPLALVGHSLGGGVCMVYAALYGQDLKRLVLVDSVGILHRLAVSQYYVKQQIRRELPFDDSGLETSIGRMGDLFLEKTSRIPFNPDLVLNSEILRAKFLGGDPSRIAALALVQTDYSLLLTQIKVPTWLLWGELDQVAAMRIAKVLQWVLPTAQLRVLPGLGHSPMFEDGQQFMVELMTALDHQPRKLPPVGLHGDAVDVDCENQDGRIFQGAYRTLRITNCQKVRLVSVRVQNLEISNSQVEIENGVIATTGQQPGIHIVGSQVTMTGADIRARTGIVTDQSRLDLAGVRFMDTPVAIQAEGRPSSVISSCSVKQVSGVKTAIHMSRTLNPGEGL